MNQELDHRGAVGPRDFFDVVAAAQFNILTTMGLREFHTLLDIGCGSLRAGRLLIPYLSPGHYFGLEPNRSLVENGLESELGACVAELKRPSFRFSASFDLSAFDRSFDFLIAQSIFSHASSQQVETCLDEARTVMHADSLFIATFVPGDDDYEGTEWVYPGVVTYRSDSIERMASDVGLSIRELAWPHPTGQQWFVAWPRDGTGPPEFEVPEATYREALDHFRARVVWFEAMARSQEDELNRLRRARTRMSTRARRKVRRLAVKAFGRTR